MRLLRRLVSAIRGSSPSPGPQHSRASLSYADRIRAIHELDTGFIHHRLMHIDGLDRSQAHIAIKQYKLLLHRALQLKNEGNLNPRTLRPDTLTDKAWHAHVLHTKRYREDCMSILGFYLDHIPDDPREAPRNAHHATSRPRRDDDTPPANGSSSGGGGDIPFYQNPLHPLSPLHPLNTEREISSGNHSHYSEPSTSHSTASDTGHSSSDSSSSSSDGGSSCGGGCGGGGE